MNLVDSGGNAVRQAFTCVVLFAALSAPAFGQAHGNVSATPRYTVVPLDPGTGMRFFGTWLNNNGDVVGCTTDAGGHSDVLMYTRGTFRRVLRDAFPIGIDDARDVAVSKGDGADISIVVIPHAGPTVGIPSTIALPGRILAPNRIVGVWATAAIPQGHAFLWSSGKLQDLGTAGGKTSQAQALSVSGVIVGYTGTADGKTDGCRWDRGRIRDLGRPPGATSAMAVDINRSGTIIGHASFGVSHARGAIVWEGDRLSLLPRPSNAVQSDATSINDQGEIVGGIRTRSGAYACLWKADRCYDLNRLVSAAPGVILTRAVAINNRGMILALSQGPGRFYLLVPRH